MKLKMVIGNKVIDSVTVTPSKLNNREYIAGLRHVLEERVDGDDGLDDAAHQHVLRQLGAFGERDRSHDARSSVRRVV